MAKRSVLTIGAGISGLIAARTLAREGRSVTVLEARERAGGRLRTIRGTNGQLPIELGAEFVHGEKVATWPLIKEAGLDTHEVPDRHWHNQDGVLREDPGFYDGFGSAIQPLPPGQADQTFASFLRSSSRLNDLQRRLLREYVEGFHAADPELMSYRAVQSGESSSEASDGDRQFRITAGYAALVDWLTQELLALGVPLRFRHVARRIHWRRGHATVHVETPSGMEALETEQALVTLPVGVLKSAGPGSLAFDPSVPSIDQALTGLEMGSVTKVVLHFRDRFWPVANFGFIHTFEEWFPTWWADERGSVLTGWAGGPRSTRLATVDQAVLAERAVAALARIFRLRPSEVTAELKYLHTYNWDQDPFSGGAYSYVRTGGADAPRVLSEPVQETLYFAGEALARPGQQGTVHSAIESGLRAARAILGQEAVTPKASCYW